MNCQSQVPGPFKDDDPFLPAQDAKIERCGECGDEHRTDLGCPVSVQGRMRLVALLAAFVVASAIGLVWGLTR